MTADLDTLEAKAAKAQAAYVAAQMAAQEAREAKQAQQDARAREIAQRVVDSYDDAAMFRQIRETREEFARVFIESDIGQAWVAVKLAELRHAHAAVDVNSAAGQVGQPSKNLSRPATNAIVEQLAQMVDTAAADAIAAELQARDTVRSGLLRFACLFDSSRCAPSIRRGWSRSSATAHGGRVASQLGACATTPGDGWPTSPGPSSTTGGRAST